MASNASNCAGHPTTENRVETTAVSRSSAEAFVAVAWGDFVSATQTVTFELPDGSRHCVPFSLLRRLDSDHTLPRRDEDGASARQPPLRPLPGRLVTAVLGFLLRTGRVAPSSSVLRAGLAACRVIASSAAPSDTALHAVWLWHTARRASLKSRNGRLADDGKPVSMHAPQPRHRVDDDVKEDEPGVGTDIIGLSSGAAHQTPRVEVSRLQLETPPSAQTIAEHSAASPHDHNTDNHDAPAGEGIINSHNDQFQSPTTTTAPRARVPNVAGPSDAAPSVGCGVEPPGFAISAEADHLLVDCSVDPRLFHLLIAALRGYPVLDAIDALGTTAAGRQQSSYHHPQTSVLEPLAMLEPPTISPPRDPLPGSDGATIHARLTDTTGPTGVARTRRALFVALCADLGISAERTLELLFTGHEGVATPRPWIEALDALNCRLPHIPQPSTPRMQRSSGHNAAIAPSFLSHAETLHHPKPARLSSDLAATAVGPYVSTGVHAWVLGCVPTRRLTAAADYIGVGVVSTAYDRQHGEFQAVPGCAVLYHDLTMHTNYFGEHRRCDLAACLPPVVAAAAQGTATSSSSSASALFGPFLRGEGELVLTIDQCRRQVVWTETTTHRVIAIQPVDEVPLAPAVALRNGTEVWWRYCPWEAYVGASAAPPEAGQSRTRNATSSGPAALVAGD